MFFFGGGDFLLPFVSDHQRVSLPRRAPGAQARRRAGPWQRLSPSGIFGGAQAGAGGAAMALEVLAEGAGVRVGFPAAFHLAPVGLVAGVHVGVLFPVAAVGESPGAAGEPAAEGLLACKRKTPEAEARRLCLTCLPLGLCGGGEAGREGQARLSGGQKQQVTRSGSKSGFSFRSKSKDSVL